MLRAGAAARLRRNALVGNGRLGIDLLPAGVTANDAGDADTGPNGLQNFPVVTSAESAGGTTVVQGSLTSLPSASFTIELFDSSACDGSGNGEAEAFLVGIPVTTSAAGSAAFTASVAAAKAPVGSVITATATHSGGNTSELSACREVADGAPPPPPPPLDHPNIVLVLSDDQSPETLPHTPAVLPWLQSQIQDPANHFVQLPNTYANTAMCCPARASILTGQYSHHTHVQSNGQGEMLDESSTLATWLHDGGYHTGLVGKYLNDYPFLRGHYIPPGWDSFVGWEGPSGHPYYNYDLNVDGVPVHHGTDPADYSTDVYKAHALDFLDAAPADEPFFLYFAPGAPHAPRTPAPRHSTLWNQLPVEHSPAFNEADVSDKPQWVQSRPPLGAAGVKQMDRFRRDQYASLAAVDEAIKAIVDKVKDRGQWDNTVFVYMTDNGVAFGENRWDSKLCPYVTCIRTPMFIRYPTQTARVETGLASNVDLAPTFAALAETTPASPVDGRNLVPLIEDAPAPWRDEVLIEWVGGVPGEPIPGYWGLYTDSYLYVEYATGEIELYDMAGTLSSPDPYLLQNRCPGSTPACSAAYAPVQADLAARLALLKPP
jgi:arylsulfatase A-like enzyme